MLLRRCFVTCWVCVSLLAVGSVCDAGQSKRGLIRPAGTLPATTPWDLVALSGPPRSEWVSQEGPVWSLYYQGPLYKGKPTRVFAYYASPVTFGVKGAAKKHFPGVVLIHGGGGTAFPEWAALWAKRGYAAIAMDLAGCGPDGKRLPDGGPGQDDDVKFGLIDQLSQDQWTYHAVADAILAHSLLRSFKEVDAKRTAVTGISWGGYLTCIVAGLDNRFKAAVPVYGCGFLHENSVWLPQFAQMTPQQREKWVHLWDPCMYVGSAAMPVLFMNGTNDFAYPLDSYARTYGLVKNRNLCITVDMPHGHQEGWNPKEIGMFVDEHLRGGKPLAKIARPEIADGQAVAKVKAKTKLTTASLVYTTETGPINKRKWETVPAHFDDDRLAVKAPPKEATIWFLMVRDERGAVSSSELVFTARP